MVKTVNISNIEDFPEDFILAKIEIEKDLSKKENSNIKFRISEFIEYLNFSHTIFMREIVINNISKTLTIPFSIYKLTNNDIFIFYIFTDVISDDIKNESVTILKNTCERINYNIKNLRLVNMLSLYEQQKYKPDTDYFIIDSQIYT